MLTDRLRGLMLAFAFVSVAFVSGAHADPKLNFPWPVNVGPLNPHLYSPNQMFAQNMVYEPLVHYNADGTVGPWLAESWEASQDGRSYTFKLREDVKFSNGEVFDAAAVKANIDTVLQNRPRHKWLELVNQMVSAEVVGPYKVRINLKNLITRYCRSFPCRAPSASLPRRSSKMAAPQMALWRRLVRARGN